MKTLILEDEAHNRAFLHLTLQQHCPQVQVVAQAQGVAEALALFRQHLPELVLLDVELPDGTGFDFLERLPQPWPKIIFITAYDHYALQAIRYSAIDYLLKPIRVQDLVQALQKASNRLHMEQEYALLQLLLQSRRETTAPKRIALPTAERIELIPVADIIRCMAENNYTHFYIRDQSSILVSKNLGEFEEMLQEFGFLRTHQSHLVNVEAIKSWEKSDGGYLLMKDGSKIPVSRSRRERVLQTLLSDE
jgi:two-component system, LytTR family, response regulator